MTSEKGAEAKSAATDKKKEAKKTTAKKKTVKKKTTEDKVEKKTTAKKTTAKKTAKTTAKKTTKKKTAASAKRIRVRQVKSGIGSSRTVRRPCPATLSRTGRERPWPPARRCAGDSRASGPRAAPDRPRPRAVPSPAGSEPWSLRHGPSGEMPPGC